MDSVERGQKVSIWSQHLESQKDSGKSVTDYCQQQGLSRHQFGYWKKRFQKKENLSFKKSSAFVQASPAVQTQSQVGGLKTAQLDAKWVAQFVLHLQMGLR